MNGSPYGVEWLDTLLARYGELQVAVVSWTTSEAGGSSVTLRAVCRDGSWVSFHQPFFDVNGIWGPALGGLKTEPAAPFPSASVSQSVATPATDALYPRCPSG